MAGRDFRGRGGRGKRRSNVHPRYQPLPPIPLPPRAGQSELSSPFLPPPEFPARFQYQEHNRARKYSSGRGGRARGKGYFQKNSHEGADISEYFSESMLEDPWAQLIEEFNQSDSLDPLTGMEVSSGTLGESATKPESLEIEMIKNKTAFSLIQAQKQDTLTPLSEFKPELTIDTSPIEPIPELEPYIPAPPREEQLEEIPLADDLISPFGACESKGLATLTTNENPGAQTEPSYEPYIPSDYPVASEDLEHSTAPLTYIPNELIPDSQETPELEQNSDTSSL